MTNNLCHSLNIRFLKAVLYKYVRYFIVLVTMYYVIITNYLKFKVLKRAVDGIQRPCTSQVTGIKARKSHYCRQVFYVHINQTLFLLVMFNLWYNETKFAIHVRLKYY